MSGFDLKKPIIFIMISTDRAKTNPCGAKVLCSYQNPTSTIQILRIDESGWEEFERIVFPGQIFLFEAPPESQLTIFYAVSPDAIEMSRISCHTLQVNQGVSVSRNSESRSI